MRIEKLPHRCTHGERYLGNTKASVSPVPYLIEILAKAGDGSAVAEATAERCRQLESDFCHQLQVSGQIVLRVRGACTERRGICICIRRCELLRVRQVKGFATQSESGFVGQPELLRQSKIHVWRV